MASPYANPPGRYRFLGISPSVPAEVNPKCVSVHHLRVIVYHSLVTSLGEPVLRGFQCCLPLLVLDSPVSLLTLMNFATPTILGSVRSVYSLCF
jgi:hypothetical protein